MDYGKYLSNDKIVVTSREYYTDSNGYQNEKAFWDFVKDMTEADRMYLMCIDVDLSPSNELKGTGYGDLVMRTLFTKIRESFPIFRMRGTKFNIFVPEDEVSYAEEIIAPSDTNKDFYIVHGMIVTDKFVSSENVKEVLVKGIKGMLGDRKDTDAVIGNIGNTPAMQQETPTMKYIAEMWFAEITFTETKPNPRTLKAYVYPTEYKSPMAMLHTIVVLDDMVEARVYDGTVVQLPIDGMRISITARFNHDGKMIISWFKSGESEGEIEGIIEMHEGNSLPANYGKRIGSTKEIYPVKMNGQGLYEYVLYDKKAVYPEKNVTYVTSGIIKGKKDTYEVHRDSTVIQLIKI